MPKVVQEMPRGNRSQYDWDTYFDGKIRMFKKGEDFETTPESFRSIAWTASQRKGLKLSASVDKEAGTVYLQVTGKLEGGPVIRTPKPKAEGEPAGKSMPKPGKKAA